MSWNRGRRRGCAWNGDSPSGLVLPVCVCVCVGVWCCEGGQLSNVRGGKWCELTFMRFLFDWIYQFVSWSINRTSRGTTV